MPHIRLNHRQWRRRDPLGKGLNTFIEILPLEIKTINKAKNEALFGYRFVPLSAKNQQPFTSAHTRRRNAFHHPSRCNPAELDKSKDARSDAKAKITTDSNFTPSPHCVASTAAMVGFPNCSMRWQNLTHPFHYRINRFFCRQLVNSLISPPDTNACSSPAKTTAFTLSSCFHSASTASRS